MVSKTKMFEVHGDNADTVAAVHAVEAANNAPTLGFDQGFATDTNGFSDSSNTDGDYGSITRVASGTNGITAPDGDGFFALVQQSPVTSDDPDPAGPYTRFGGSSEGGTDFVDGSQAGVRVYLDTSWSENTSFQYSVAVNNATDGSYRDEFFFLVRADGDGTIEVGTGGSERFQPITSPLTGDHTVVTQSGWYTLQHVFHNVDGMLSVDLNLVDQNGNITHIATESTSDAIAATATSGDTTPADQGVGGVRYGWVTQTNVPNGLAVDDYKLGALDKNVAESATPHQAVTTSGEIPFTDTDTTDTHTVTSAPVTGATGYVGTFAATVTADVDGNGHGAVGWTYSAPAGAFDYLKPGQNVSQSYTVTVNDGHGGTSSEVVTVTINGTDTTATHTGGFAVFTDDTHAITATTSSSDTTTYSGGYTLNLLSDTSDPDSTLQVDPNSVTFVVRDSNGNVISDAPTYSLSDGHSAFLDSDGKTLHVNTALLNSLNVGQSDQISVNYTVTGDQGGASSADFSDNRIIAVSGTNDSPTLSDGSTAIPETNLPHNFDLLANASDVDNSKSQLHIASGYTVMLTTADGTSTLSTDDYTLDSQTGTLTLKTGTYTDMLHNNQSDTVTVHYQVTDGNTSSAAHDYAITVQGQPEQISGMGAFNGTQYDDNINGSNGNDTINGLTGNDTIFGLQGDDTLSGNQGDDVLNGGQGNDHLFGGQGTDTLYGAAGNDTLEGGVGDDTINGGSIIQGNQVDDGVNTVSYQYASAGTNFDGSSTLGVTVHLDTTDDNGNFYADGPTTGHDTLIDIQNVVGSAYNDTIYGGINGSNIVAGAGDDYIVGGDGNNVIYGNQGNDTIIGGSGDDTLNGGQGDDTISAGTGHNVIQGGVNNVSSGADDNAIHGDTLAYDSITTNGTAHAYTDGTTYTGVIVDLSVASEQATYTDASGRGAFDTISGIENLTGSHYSDALNGDANANVLAGLEGDDRLQGNDGNDTIYGGQGNDTIYGNVGDDVLHGNAGNDVIVGGQGNDLLDGGTGQNTLTGGLGADTFMLSYSTSTPTNTTVPFFFGNYTVSDTITDFSGSGGQGDKIDLSQVSSSQQESLHFVGNFFTGAAGDIIVTQGNGAGHYLLEIDLNGDGNADFIANVNGATAADGSHAAPPGANDFTGLTYTPDNTTTQLHVDHHADIFG